MDNSFSYLFIKGTLFLINAKATYMFSVLGLPGVDFHINFEGQVTFIIFFIVN